MTLSNRKEMKQRCGVMSKRQCQCISRQVGSRSFGSPMTTHARPCCSTLLHLHNHHIHRSPLLYAGHVLSPCLKSLFGCLNIRDSDSPRDHLPLRRLAKLVTATATVLLRRQHSTTTYSTALRSRIPGTLQRHTTRDDLFDFHTARTLCILRSAILNKIFNPRVVDCAQSRYFRRPDTARAAYPLVLEVHNEFEGCDEVLYEGAAAIQAAL
jgi:hypothetical protein